MINLPLLLDLQCYNTSCQDPMVRQQDFLNGTKKFFEIIITIFLLYLSFLQTLPYISHHSLSNSLPLFFTSCYCMVRYTQIHIPKYNRFSLLYNVAYMYIFRADWHWTISLCTCPWRPPLLFPVSFSYVQLCMVLWIGLSPCGLPLPQDVLVSSLLSSFLSNHVDETLWV